MIWNSLSLAYGNKNLNIAFNHLKAALKWNFTICSSCVYNLICKLSYNTFAAKYEIAFKRYKNQLMAILGLLPLFNHCTSMRDCPIHTANIWNPFRKSNGDLDSLIPFCFSVSLFFSATIKTHTVLSYFQHFRMPSPVFQIQYMVCSSVQMGQF